MKKKPDLLSNPGSRHNLRIMKTVLLLLFVGFTIVPSFQGFAQPASRLVKGKVTDINNTPIQGVTIYPKGTTRGVATNANGEFSIQLLPGDEVLVSSFVGMKTQETRVGNRTTINIRLEEDIAQIDEVVVTGYQSISKERVTGSFAKIESKELERTIVYNIEDKLSEMQLSGVLYDPNLGFSIRGISTIDASRIPLVIVDGFPLQIDKTDLDDMENFTRALNSINPGDVESITVLKDAAAASIYGARAANGVIVINLKRTSGKMAEPEVIFNSSYTVSPKPDIDRLPYANPETYYALEKGRWESGWFINSGSAYWDPNFTNVPEYYYVRAKTNEGIFPQQKLDDLVSQMQTYDNRYEFSDYFLQPKTSQKYNLSINHRAGFSNYRFSASYDKNQAPSKGDNNDRFVINLLNQSRPVKWLIITTSLNLSLINEENNGALMSDLFGIPQHQRILDEDGNYTSMSNYSTSMKGQWYREDIVNLYKYFPYDWKWNIKREVDNKDNSVKSYETRIQGGLAFKPFGEVLTLEAKYQYERGSEKTSGYNNEETYLVRNLVNTYAQEGKLPVPKGGILEHIYRTSYSHDFIGLINFNKTFFKKHNFVVLLGSEMREQSYDRSNVRRYGYDPQTLSYIYQLDFASQYPRNLVANQSAYYIDPSAAWSTIYNYDYNIDRFVSLFWNFAYNFNDKIDFTTSWRLDKSNMFGDSPEYRNVPLWSIGAGYTMISNSGQSGFAPFIDRLRFRATYGISGNVDKTTSPYAIAAIGGSYNNSQLVLPGAKFTNPANADLRWEKTKQFNIGTEFALLDYRISGSLEYYEKHSSDLLTTKNINTTYGFNNAKINFGAMVNKGLDLSLSILLINKTDFSWRTQPMISYNTNKITETGSTVLDVSSLANALGNQDYRIVKDRPRFYLVSLPWGGLDAEGYPMFYHKDSLYRWKDTPQATILAKYKFTDLKYEGTTLAPYYGSWNNIIRYKNWELSSLMTFKFGHVYQHVSPFRVSNNDLFGFAQGNYVPHYAKEFENIWKEPGDESNTDIPKLPFELPGATVRAGSAFYTYPVNYGSHQTMNASHVRFQRVSLAYTLPQRSLPWKMERLTIMAQGRNIGLITFNKYKEDPEYLPDMMGSFLLRLMPEYTLSIVATF